MSKKILEFPKLELNNFWNVEYLYLYLVFKTLSELGKYGSWPGKFEDSWSYFVERNEK